MNRGEVARQQAERHTPREPSDRRRVRESQPAPPPLIPTKRRPYKVEIPTAAAVGCKCMSARGQGVDLSALMLKDLSGQHASVELSE